MDYKLIGQQIRKYRKLNGISQEELAFQMGISTTHMSHIETGSTKLSLPVLVNASDVLHVSIDRLVHGDTKPETSLFMEAVPALSECDEREKHIAAELVRAYLSASKKYPN